MPAFGTDEKPADTSYYELLNVDPVADDAKIKKAYRYEENLGTLYYDAPSYWHPSTLT